MKKIRFFTLTFLLALGLSACVDKPETLPTIPKPIKWLNRPDNFTLPNFTGKITILGFYTEDCSGCAKIQPTLTKAMSDYGDKTQVIGVYTPLPHQTSTLPEIKKFLKKHKVLYPIILDKRTKILRLFRVTSWPTIIIVNQKQHIIYRLHRSEAIIHELPKILLKANRD